MLNNQLDSDIAVAEAEAPAADCTKLTSTQPVTELTTEKSTLEESELTSSEQQQPIQRIELPLEQLRAILEAALFAAEAPLSLERLQTLFSEAEKPSKATLREVLDLLAAEYTERCHGVELQEVASGYRFQVKQTLAPWLQRLWERKAPRYSRAVLETLALIVYRQPITRAEIEEVRGVAVSSQIIKTLMDRDWISIVGYRELPGRPALFGTTKQFLDDMNVRSLMDLPPLEQLSDFEALTVQTNGVAGELNLPMPQDETDAT